MARPTVCNDKYSKCFLTVNSHSPPFPWPGILQVTEDPPACPQVLKHSNKTFSLLG